MRPVPSTLRWSLRAFVFVLGLLASAADGMGQSVYMQRPDDAHAVYLERGRFGAAADGKADDSAALQAAIDQVQATTGAGAVFVAQGRYRVSRTIFVWQGIRLIGYGAERPVLVLGANTPSYQSGHDFLGTGRYMVQFSSRRPTAGAAVVDANEFTFYSGASNIDIEIGDGNPAAIAIRFHVAQHSFLAHMNIQVGQGRAALEDVGNQASDLHMEGGDYGIISVRTAPAWQFLLMDSSLDGQRKAAIHTQEAGLTLVRDRIAHTPVAVEIAEGKTEQLFGRDLVLEDIGQAAIVLGDARKAHHEVTLEHVFCANVAQLVQGGEGVAGLVTLRGADRRFVEEHLSIGLEIGNEGRERGVAMRHREIAATAKGLPESDIPVLPPMQEWANVRELGAKGDGGTDDTAALQAAIEQHRVLYFPSGTYRVRNTLRLRPDSVLIGFNPATTLIAVWDNEAAFEGAGDAVPVVLSARGGAARLSGIGISTGDIDPRAAGLVWRAGARSMVEDVNFMSGHGRQNTMLAPLMPRPATTLSHSENYFSTQYPSLWVKDGGGGIFRGIWTASSIARAGLLVENTATPSVVYQMSCEHHLHHETQFHQVSNWTVYALQTEEEMPAGAESFSVELVDARHMTFANLFEYRVSRNVMPRLNGVEASRSTDVRFENVHNFSQTRLAFDNSVFDWSTGVRVRAHDFTSFALTAATKPGAPLALPRGVFAPNARLERLATGFSNASGLTTDDAGDLFFTDAALHRIYRWDEKTRQAEVLSDKVAAPMAVGSVASGWLLALDAGRSVYSASVASGATARVEAADGPQARTRLLLPVGLHNAFDTLAAQMEHHGVVYAPRSNMAIVADVAEQPRDYFYAPGTDTAIMAGGNWQPMLQASQWRVFELGEEHLAVSEEDDAVCRMRLDSLRSVTLTKCEPRGGTSVVNDSAGNVYIAAGEIYVYNAAGQQIGVVEVPERPSSLAFGGNGRRTLFIGARGSLFAIQTQAAGL